MGAAVNNCVDDIIRFSIVLVVSFLWLVILVIRTVDIGHILNVRRREEKSVQHPVCKVKASVAFNS